MLAETTRRVDQEGGEQKIHVIGWAFASNTELCRWRLPKLSVSAAGACDGIEGNNGFEVLRVISREYDFVHGMSEFDLAGEVTNLGRSSANH